MFFYSSSGEISMTNIVELSKKIVLIGDPAVGKTSMIRKFVHDIFDDKYISTLGTKVSSKVIRFNHPVKDAKIELKLMIWDIMGQKDYEMFQQSAFMGSQGAIIVCDATRKPTLENLPEWVSSLFNVTEEIPIVMIANKNDLTDQKQFELEDLINVASTFDVPSLLASAKTGENVETAFTTLGQIIIDQDYKK
jgi:small GTP-binding protein